MDNAKSELLNALHIDRAALPERHWPRWLLVAAGLLLPAAALAVIAWPVLQERAEPVRIALARPLPGTAAPAAGAALLDASGYVVARRQATVGPKIAGKLRDVLVEEGMSVGAGQVIAHLDDSNALAAFNQAKAALDQAETSAADARPVFERNRAQLAQGLISRETHDTAKSNFDLTQTTAAVARSALAVARQNLDDTVVRAPFAGVVTAKAAQPGEIVSPLSAGAGFTRTGIATIVDMDSLEVDVDVSENFINRVRPEQRCTATLNAYADWQIPAHVIAVVPTADRSKATVKVRVAIDAKDPRILPEMGTRVAFLADVKQGQPAAPAGVMVPADAVNADGQEGVVFVVRDGRAERRAVKLGTRTPDGQIVLAGLSGGETVVVAGRDKLADGAKVRIEQ
jgi:HlyD family secretion protein